MAQPQTPPRRGVSLGSVLRAIDTGISRIEAFILAYGTLLLALNSIANVVAREIGQSLYFAEEISQFLIILVTFVGIGYATRQARHIRMSAVYDHLGKALKKGLTIVISLITAIFMFGLAYYSFDYVSTVAARGRVTPALQIPLYLTYLWLPVGFTITGIHYLLAVYKNIISKDIYLSYDVKEGYEEVDHTSAAT